MTINMFAILLSLHSPSHGRVKYISDLRGLARSHPVLAGTLTLTLFSMAGIPPLAGFCSKFYLFFAALGSSLYVLAFVGVLTSCVSCFYYIRLIKIMYFEQPAQWLVYSQIDKEKALLLGITLLFILGFFFYPSPLFVLSHKVALAFCL
jgi:NADH:ubiquinone oxidoreductase subunit 2 (subunit N)